MRVPKFSPWFWPIVINIVICGSFAIFLTKKTERHNDIMYEGTVRTAASAAYLGCRFGLIQAGPLLSDENGPNLEIPKELVHEICKDFAIWYINNTFPPDDDKGH
jgi:hypothetical protein